MSFNSTNGHSVRKAPLFLRTWFGALSALAPTTAEKQAAKMFITPRLRRTPTPTALHAKLLPERAMERRAGGAEPAYPVLSTGRVALWSWGRGPTVLLVHGWSGGAGDMAPIAAELVRAGYRAVMFDMPGHGDSEHRDTNLYVYLETIAAVGALVGPIEAIVGHSLGGTAIAVALGNRLITAKRAVLLAPALSPWSFSYHFARIIGLAQELVPGMVRRTEQLVGRSADSLSAVEAVKELDMPGYLVHDPEDLDVPFEHSTTIAAAWKGARLVTRTGLGHRGILKDAATISGILKFIRGQQPAGAQEESQGAGGARGAQEQPLQRA
ncbi:MAG: alpha/beta hydrolase [Gemmatimonadota bacterium]